MIEYKKLCIVDCPKLYGQHKKATMVENIKY